MGNAATNSTYGFVCPVKGCDKKHNRRFGVVGMAMHLFVKHPGEFEKRLKLKKERK